jgi:alkylation response protein AidB-like acyl-CoA dehydrogenase
VEDFKLLKNLSKISSHLVVAKLINMMLFTRRLAHRVAGRTSTPILATRALSSPTDTTVSRPEPQVATSLLQIGTRRIFEHEHDQYRELCRRFYAEKVVPYHAEWEEKGQVPRELWKDAGANGLLCVTMPEQYGGMGLDVKYAAVHWEEQSYAGTTGPGFFLHSEIVAPYILHYGTEEQKQKYLPRLATGEWISAIAMTEPGAGSDLAGMRTTATKSGDDYIINGSKTYITNGYLSDLVIVCAKTDPTKGAKVFILKYYLMHIFISA